MTGIKKSLSPGFNILINRIKNKEKGNNAPIFLPTELLANPFEKIAMYNNWVIKKAAIPKRNKLLLSSNRTSPRKENINANIYSLFLDFEPAT